MTGISKLGRYELRRILGKGAMGVVYEGYDPTLSRRVAVKTILKSVALDDETDRSYAERFVREAKAVARLNHPNIIQVFDFGVENEVAYLVMEFIQGRELRDFFTAGEAFEARESIRIMGELLDALEFAHEAGVIHRDVKPANVMLDGQRRVKLADFGVARVQDSDRSAAGTMVGTPAFMSPEQISGGKVDRRSDIFSAGTILYQLLTGEQPFKGEGAWTVAKQIMQDDPPAPSSVVKSVSPAFDAIVDKALAKRVSDRYSSAREFATSLRGALSAPAGPTAPAAAAQKPKAMPQASETELEFWRSIQNRDDLEELELFLEQFPEGAYAQLARLKLGKLRAPVEAARAAEEKAKRESEEQARREAEAKAKREADDKAQREAQEHARRAAAERVQRLAEDKARHEAAEKAKREAEEKAKRAAEEKARQAAALARLKQPEAAAPARAAVDHDVTVALGSGRAPTPPAAERKTSYAIPVVAAAIVIAGAVGAYLVLGRKPAPLAESPAQASAPAPTVDSEKIRRETEERVRKEFAEKAVAERAVLEKAVVEKLAAERAAAEKVTQAKTAAERATAEKAAAAAAAERMAAEKAAAAKASEKAMAEKANAERAAAERAAAEKTAAEKAAGEKAAAEKAAEKSAAEKAAAEKQAAAVGQAALLERFVQRHGKDKVLNVEPPLIIGTRHAQEFLYPPNSALYINDGSCGAGAIKEIRIENPNRNTERSYRCISLADDNPTAVKPAAAKPAAAAPAAAPIGIADGDAQLERFIQRKGRDKVVRQEPPQFWGAINHGEVFYVNDGSCPPGRIREVLGASTMGGSVRPSTTRCISLTD